MASILVMTSPARGHLYPLVETLLELRAHGHAVYVSTLSSEVATLADLGIDGCPLPTELDEAELADAHTTGVITGLMAVGDQLFARCQAEYEHFSRLIAEREPDLLLCDLTTPGAQMAAERSGLPWAVWSPTYLPAFSTDGPPPLIGLPVKRGMVGRARDFCLGHTARRALDLFALRRGNEFRTKFGLAPIDHVDEQFVRAPLVLNFLGAPIEKQRRDWPASVKLVGPSTWAPPSRPDPRIAAIDRPVALVTCSTEMQNDGMLAQVTLDALEHTGFHTVVTTGAMMPEILRKTAHSTVMQFGPHDQILDNAAVVVTHGGMGITMKALARGIPMVIAPFGRDQHDTAQRVVTSGAGVRVDPRALDAAGMHAAIMTALGQRGRARAAATSMDAKNSGVRAAEHVEELLRDRGEDRAVA